MATDLSPAERFQAARVRNRSRNLELFRNDLRFDLDRFQLAACDALDQGRSVLVAAPTGAGKTIVAEFAIWLAMRQPTAKVFYTTPMKALSNQKYTELGEEYHRLRRIALQHPELTPAVWKLMGALPGRD